MRKIMDGSLEAPWFDDRVVIDEHTNALPGLSTARGHPERSLITAFWTNQYFFPNCILQKCKRKCCQRDNDQI